MAKRRKRRKSHILPNLRAGRDQAESGIRVDFSVRIGKLIRIGKQQQIILGLLSLSNSVV